MLLLDFPFMPLILLLIDSFPCFLLLNVHASFILVSQESKSISDEKLSLHPPIELFNKLSLRSEKETREVCQLKKNPSAKELKENTPNCLPIKFRKCVGKPNQCAAGNGTARFGHHLNMNRSLGIR